MGNVYPGPSGSRQLDRASSFTNIFDGSHQTNVRGSDVFKSSSAHFVSRPDTMQEAVPACYSYAPQGFDHSSLSLSRPHSWPGTTTFSQNLALNSRYSTSEKEADHVHLVDFLALPESRGHGHMGTASADGIQLDLTMATGPASEDHIHAAQSSHSKSKVDLDLTLDLSMSTR